MIPANGFSCSRQTSPYCSAVRRITSMHELVVIGREVRVLEDRGDLVLARGDLVVPRLDRDAELEHLGLAVGHAREHALRDGAEVLVFQFLALRRLGAEQRPTAVEQVGPGVEEVLVDQEVFLLRADGGEHLPGLGVAEQAKDAQRLVATGPPCDFKSGVFLSSASPVQETNTVGMTSVAPFGRFADVGGAGRVPAGVAAGLEGRADAARGEAARRPVRPSPAPCR